MEAVDILAEASCLLTDTRQQTYGSFWENHRRIGVMWGELLQLEEAILPETVAVMMALMKISRIANDSTHTDNYIDAIAYLSGAGELATS
jgi:hypothetical protein|tara:strand:+ start:2161 stop:2430 length:270 start_codon:yes stop_codon:yes gene_type:complete